MQGNSIAFAVAQDVTLRSRFGISCEPALGR